MRGIGRTRRPARCRARTLAGIAAAAALALAGCAAFRPAPGLDPPPACARFFDLLDAAVAAAGTGDGGSARVPGFPNLRVNRFLAAAGAAAEAPEAREFVLDWMRALDLEARAREIDNLPAPPRVRLAAALGESPDGARLKARAAACSAALAEHDRRAPVGRLRVPEEYATAMQVAGLYPLAALPVLALTVRAQEKFRGWHREPLDRLPWRGRARAYLPEGALPFSAAEAARIVADASRNPLAAPRPAGEDAGRLLAMFAPAILQDEAGPDDRIGAVAWADGRPEVDAAEPALYTYLSHARLRGRPVLQLNYVFWYPARSGPDAPAIERGPLDGLTVRLSLAPDGAPFMLDVMNNCGCYHFFVPDRAAVRGGRRNAGELPPFVPRFLPEGFPRERLLLRVNSGWHQVDHVGTLPLPPGAAAADYRLFNYERLESLPAGEAGRMSLFGPDGVARGSERIEPLLLFSMGVPKVGSMRQRGHHAVRFIGRAHFDDPDLIDCSFDFR
jgi:hypothetical protein